MKVSRFASNCIHQTWFLYNLKKVFFSRGRLQNFSSSSYFIDDKNKNIQRSQIEKIKSAHLVSKKYNQLSKVEEENIEIVESLKKGNLYHPYESLKDRFIKVQTEDLKISGRKVVKAFTGLTIGNLQHEFFLRHTDILIIGGGAVGLSIAYSIKNKYPFGPEVIVVDKDNSFPHSSTNLGQGIVTLQLFTDEEEIEALKYGAEFFSSFSRNTQVDGRPDFKLPYDPLGSLHLIDNSNVEQEMKRIDLLKKYGISNKILDNSTLKKKFPWLNVDDVLFGNLGMLHEGMIDPWIFLIGLRCKCINLGVHFVTAEVIDFGFSDCNIKRAICKLPDGTYNSIDFAICIIASGLESLNLVNVLNEKEDFVFRLKLPLEERLRYEYCFYNPEGPGMDTPWVIDSSGTYFRREGLIGHYIAGVSSIVNNENENEPYEVFQNKIEPFLIKRLPRFIEADIVRGWIDAYDFCISNEVGIIGPHPDTHSLHFALGFSHLGLQYVPAVGRAVMEYIIDGSYRTLSFERYHIEKLWMKQHLEADKRRQELLEAQQRVALSSGELKITSQLNK